MKTTTTCTDCGERITETPLNHAEYGRALCPACRYHDAPAKSQSIELDDPQFERAVAGYATPDLQPYDEMTGAWSEYIANWLFWLAGSGNAKLAANRTIIAAHVADRCKKQTDAQLARKLNISAARLSQYRREIIERFGRVGHCNNRQD